MRHSSHHCPGIGRASVRASVMPTPLPVPLLPYIDNEGSTGTGYGLHVEKSTAKTDAHGSGSIRAVWRATTQNGMPVGTQFRTHRANRRQVEFVRTTRNTAGCTAAVLFSGVGI